MNGMKPPYYNAIVEYLSAKDRSGVDSVKDSELESVRRICLESKEYGHMNRTAWAEFIEHHPADKAARYMKQFVFQEV